MSNTILGNLSKGAGAYIEAILPLDKILRCEELI